MYRFAAVAALALTTSLSLTAADETPAEQPKLTELKDKASYVVGQQVADAIKRLELDADKVLMGLNDGVAGKPPLINMNDAQQVMMDFDKERRAKQGEAGKKRKETNPAYLAENGKKAGVTTTKSGLQYEVIASGNGKSPVMGDSVVCNYKGQLLDGTVFDESARHGGPITFEVGRVIQGWNEALQMMKEGDKWKLTIPSDIAYGENGQPPTIGPNEILIFEVELVQVKPKAALP